MVPAVVGGVGAIAGSFVASNVTSVLDDIANIKDSAYEQQYQSKELALRLSSNYTTSTKDLDGSLIPNSFSMSNSRSNQIERLIQSTLNQTKYRG